MNRKESIKRQGPLTGSISTLLGIVIFAKNEYIQECFIREMANGDFQKQYLTVVEGLFKEKSGIINEPIARKSGSIIERCISQDGQVAITEYQVLREFDNMSLVLCTLKTGRTHQIRVHMAHIGHPVLGDSLYGNPSNLVEGHALHSYKVSFIHPITQKMMIFECKPPFMFESKRRS